MNQTNFGFNPARNTLIQTQNGNGEIMFDSLNGQRIDRQQLNTQKRNRTQTIQSPTVAGVAHLRGNSLNLHELYNTY